ncbi:hypothetical protein M404DRAFT_52388, partial [Pisolithus tinctorius Marx 270]
EWFQCSGDTISRVFHWVLEACISPPVYGSYVKLPGHNAPIPPEIHVQPKFYPFFKDALGAIDGTHTAALVPTHMQAPYQNCK